jgi:hypothetical protein
VHLGGHLGDLQPPQQVLPLDQQSHDDLPALFPRGQQGRAPLCRRRGIGLGQDRQHLRHLAIDQQVEMFLHLVNLGVDRQRVQAVLVELLELNRQDPAHQLAGHAADLLLHLLRRFDPGRLRSHRRGADHAGEKTGQKTAHDIERMGATGGLSASASGHGQASCPWHP